MQNSWEPFLIGIFPKPLIFIDPKNKLSTLKMNYLNIIQEKNVKFGDIQPPDPPTNSKTKF